MQILNNRITLFLVLTLLAPLLANARDLAAIPTSLSAAEQELIAWVDARQDSIVDELRQHVEINSGTDNIYGLDQYRDLLQSELKALGFKTKRHPSDSLQTLSCSGGQVFIADHLVARHKGPGQKILLNGHMDTVFSATDEFQGMQVLADGTIKGPGVADMKGGLVVMLNALRALQANGQMKDANFTVLLNSDEEIGSLGSRKLIEKLAREHDIGVVFEGSYQNELTLARKGLGQVRLKITGRESHAGAAHEDGVSASLELAHKIIELEKLTDYESQSTVNVGVISGGEKRNTVPGCADAYIDLRFTTAEAGEELKQRILEVANSSITASEKFPEYPATETWAVLHRPVKAEDPVVNRLIQEAMGLSNKIGEPITGARHSGGGTDGSIAQAMGLPTIDSLGVDGAGAHSSRESTSVASLIARTKLAAVMLSRMIYSPDD